MPKLNMEKERFVYYSSHSKQISHNGLYIIRAGETLPNPYYYHERPAGFKTRLEGVFVMEYVFAGKGYIECEGKTYIVEAGDFFMLTRYHAHRYYSDPIDPLHKIWVNLAGPFTAGLAEALNLTEGVYVKHFDSPRGLEQIHSLLEAYKASPNPHIFDNIALVVTELMLTMNSSRKTQKVAVSPVILEIKKYIDGESNVAASLDDICAKFSINKSYAIATFKKEFGITLYQYMLEKKIAAAKQMLDSGVGIGVIASSLGYSCTQAFTHAFKSATGVSPNMYREQKNSYELF